MTLPKVAVVDADNRFVRWDDRRVVHRDRLFHRSIHVLLFDAAGRLVIQKRQKDKLTYPSHWDLSCSGHVEAPDYAKGPDDDVVAAYDLCARRELREELGVDAELEPLGWFAPMPGLHYEQIRLYRGTHDGPYVAQPEEVLEVRAVTPAELSRLLAREPATGTLRFFSRAARFVTIA